MLDFAVNYTHIIVAAAAAFVLGMVWWAPQVFGKAWLKAMEASGKDMAKMQKESDMKVSFGLSALGWLLAAYVMAYLLAMLGMEGWQGGAKLGFWMWLGFTGSIGINTVVFSGQPKTVFYINQGYYLAGLMLIGAILNGWV